MPSLKTESLLELDYLLRFVEKAVKSQEAACDDYRYQLELERKLTAYNTEAMMQVMMHQTLDSAQLSESLNDNRKEIAKVLRQLDFVQKQLDEIKIKPDQDYVDNLSHQLFQLEKSLLGTMKLTLPEVQLSVQDRSPQEVTTPYDAKIEEAMSFFSSELRESDLA